MWMDGWKLFNFDSAMCLQMEKSNWDVERSYVHASYDK